MKTQDLLNELKAKEWVNLTHEITKDMAIYQAFNPLGERVLTTLEETGSDNREYTLGTSHGTHVDAPAHFMAGGRILSELPLKERYLPLYVLHLEKEVEADNGYAVSVEDIKKFEETYGEIPEGVFVAFSSGWYHRIYSQEDFTNTDEKGVEITPGWSVAALKYLSETRKITAIGHETLNTDSGPEAAEAGDLVAQRYWLNQNKFQVEVMANLDKVPATGAVIMINVLHIKDAVAFPAEVIAVLDK
ncbi:cyclase family protein [Aedoeadaptatus coxii]|uniref:cyclase family protein n=1 Tax=Aedoeadaptatus coxii TaxID=755172 RepID=UPI002AD4686B|nr:cyclase family protein [Peptoniphilus coxii]